MVSSNALQRTFHINYKDKNGTCFTIDVDQKQYIVTARHVIPDATQTLTVQIFHEEKWKDLDCKLVGIANDEIDIIVLAADIQISPAHKFTPTTNGMFLSQDAYFLGFPYGFKANVGGINNDFPLPIVKKACVSLLELFPTKVKYLLLDAHNNPGFSGGPVVFSPSSNPNEMRVAAVVSGYRFVWDKVFQDNQETNLSYKYNTGLLIAYAIDYAIELINTNPIGFPIAFQN